MKKTLLAILATVVALTMVMGLAATASAGKPQKTAVTGVDLDKTDIAIAVGASDTLTATIYPGDAANQRVRWTTSDRRIATVRGHGLAVTVNGANVGTATITVATADGGFTATCTVQVTVALAGIGPIVGTPEVGQTLTAGALSPAGATATYQWKSCDTIDGTYTDISGATSNTYTLVAGDFGKYIKVAATGSGTYTGTVTSAATSQVTTPLTGIGAISGTPEVGQTLTAGALSPAGATATYQWKRAVSEGGTYLPISGATSNTYVLGPSDVGMYMKVTATGSGAYTGVITSAATSQVTRPLTGIGAIFGTPLVGVTLTAGTLSPAGATATYQWRSCDTVDGTYADISGATSNTYTLVAGDLGRYIKVAATGSGAYTGTVTSAATSQVTTPLTGIGAISGTPEVGQTLTAGALSPAGATATYQWKSCETIDGTYTDISGATSNTYTLVAGDIGEYIKVAATGSGAYTGTVTSSAVKVQPSGTLFGEDFTGVGQGALPAGWTTTRSDLCYVNNSALAGGVAPELELEYDDGAGSAATLYSDYRVSTPAIDATALSSSLNLSFKSEVDIYAFSDDNPFTIAVEVSTDGGTTWVATSFSITIDASSETTYPDLEIPAQTVNVDLSAYAGETIKVSWRMYQYTYQANWWMIDDVIVAGT